MINWGFGGLGGRLGKGAAGKAQNKGSTENKFCLRPFRTIPIVFLGPLTEQCSLSHKALSIQVNADSKARLCSHRKQAENFSLGAVSSGEPGKFWSRNLNLIQFHMRLRKASYVRGTRIQGLALKKPATKGRAGNPPSHTQSFLLLPNLT